MTITHRGSYGLDWLKPRDRYRPPDRPFKSDGCSGSFMCLLRRVWWVRYKLGLEKRPTPPWEPDCEAHDARYHPGGMVADRVDADAELLRAVAARGYPRLARMMFIGVSAGGLPWLPLPWRWGYGYRWPRGYDDRPSPWVAKKVTQPESTRGGSP